jgi:hypothetical protein
MDNPSALDRVRSSRLWLWMGGAILFLLAVVLPLARQEGVRPWRVVWAEDGVVYYSEALRGGVGTLFRGYDGYVQFLPRLLMAPTPLLPIESVSVYVAVVTAVFGALVAAFVYRSTDGWIASRSIRVVVAAFYVLGPAAVWEQTGNATNTIWFVLAAVPWALLSKRDGSLDLALRGLVVVVAALSQPASAIFVPLAALAVWRRRDTGAWLVGGLLTAGVVVQGLLMLSAPTRHARTDAPLLAAFPTTAVDTLGSFLVGERPLPELWLQFGFALVFVFAVAAALIVFICALGTSKRSLGMGLMLAGYAIVLALVPLLSNGPIVLKEGVELVPIDRYVYAPVALLVGAIAVLIDPPDRTRTRTIARVARPLLIIHSVIVILVSFSVWTPRSSGPMWADSVDMARRDCLTGVEEATVALTPPGWIVSLPCDELAR